MSLSPAGLRLDTVYTSGQIRFEAAVVPQQALVVHFGTDRTKDEVTLRIPLSKLRPGWGGTYSFLNVTGAPSPYIQPVPGDVDLTYWFRYYPPFVASLSDYFYAEPGSFVITRYDAPRRLISGHFRYESNSNLSLPPVVTAMQRYKLVITGAFDNLPIAP